MSAGSAEDEKRLTRRVFLRAAVLSGTAFSFLLGSKKEVSANDQRYVNLFFKNGYAYCDARKLAKVYRTSPWRAKIIGGQKIASGNANTLRVMWQRGAAIFQRNGMSCSTGSLDNEVRRYSYNDAKPVADMWSKKGG